MFDEAMSLLCAGEIDVEGRMPWSSNATFLVNVSLDGETKARAIYKPGRGERPLWDFPPPLYKREYAAYLLSEALGWHLVPPTVIRDGPYGEGSMQLFVPSNFEEHYFSVYEQRPEHHGRLQAMCAFDVMANNTDRKGGHVLLSLEDQIWGIDHGLCFAAAFKLRTVIWDFGGDELPEELIEGVSRIARRVPLDIAALLDDEEVEALQGRAARLLATRAFPTDPTGQRHPWPLV